MSKSKNVRVCRRCGCRKTKVIDCRQYNGIMHRMRRCTSCGNRWTTVEIDSWWFDRMLAALNAAEGMGEKHGKETEARTNAARGLLDSQDVYKDRLGLPEIFDGPGDAHPSGAGPRRRR